MIVVAAFLIGSSKPSANAPTTSRALMEIPEIPDSSAETAPKEEEK